MALLINEDFNPWSGNISPDGIWRINGVWSGTGGNLLEPSLATLTSTYPGDSGTGFLHLTIAPSANPLEGAEIQTLTGYGYGYYEVRMMPSSVPGGVASFFLIGAPNYTQPEFDIEFLLGAHNQVTFTNHPGSGTTYYNLGFDPTAAFHLYGILWTPGPGPGVATVADTVDGVIVHSETSASFVAPPNGEFIMMNTWSGNANFGGGPPTQNSTSVYDWVHFEPMNGGSPPQSPTVAFSPEAAGTIVYTAEYGSAPSASELSILVQFTNPQYAYGQQIGVMDPAVYAYQSLGVALASTATQFQNTFGPPNPTYPATPAGDAQFATDAYASVFGHPAGPAQIQLFVAQLNFFETLYTSAGGFGSPTNIDLLARGAVYGQMLGIEHEIDPTALGDPSGLHASIVGIAGSPDATHGT